MPNIDILIVAILRGASEILPVDPGAHAALLKRLLCWPDHGNMLIAVADGGILAALLVYFWRDVFGMVRSLGRVLQGKRDPGAYLMLHLLLGSLPAFLLTFGLRYLFDFTIRDPVYISVLLVAFGVVLYVGDQVGLTVRRIEQMNIGQAMIIGFFQGLVLLPGVSRVGIAMTVARTLGYERVDAARFTLLLSIPWMAASGLYRLYLGTAAREAPDPDRMVLMALAAGIAAFLAVAFIMYWLRHGSFTLFVIYRVALGGVLLYVLYKLPTLVC